MAASLGGEDRQELIESLVLKYQARLRSFLFSRTGGRDVADDIAQEVFLVAFMRLDEYDPERPAFPWIMGIAHNKLREHWRRLVREKCVDPLDAFVAVTLAGDEPDMRAVDVHEQRLEALRACLERVEGVSRSVLDMTYVDKLTSSQIGKRINKEATAVRVLLHRVRRGLGECIQGRLKEAMS
jgi:RNA polymerase sigma-70 factor (ECF subfamily)